MKLILMKWAFLTTLCLSLFSGCSEGDDCNNCGGTLLDGYVFLSVTADHLAKYEGLALLEGVDLGVCIRGKITEEELNIQTVAVVDDCCCE